MLIRLPGIFGEPWRVGLRFSKQCADKRPIQDAVIIPEITHSSMGSLPEGLTENNFYQKAGGKEKGRSCNYENTHPEAFHPRVSLRVNSCHSLF
jgi:hypothetical protein